MKYLSIIVALLASSFVSATGSIQQEGLVGLWVPGEGYRWNIPKYSLKVNPDFSAVYFNSEHEFVCPKEHFSETNDIFQFRCFSGKHEVKRLSLGGWGPYLSGFEFWVGGSPDTPTGMYGGGPIGLERDGAYIRK